MAVARRRRIPRWCKIRRGSGCVRTEPDLDLGIVGGQTDATTHVRYRYQPAILGRGFRAMPARMALYAGYGEGMALHGADALVVNISQTPGVVILEYEVQGNAVGSGKLYENRFISVVTIEGRKIVGWRDYMDSLAVMSSLT